MWREIDGIDGETGDSEQSAEVRGCGVLHSSPGSDWIGRVPAHGHPVDKPAELRDRDLGMGCGVGNGRRV